MSVILRTAAPLDTTDVPELITPMAYPSQVTIFLAALKKMLGASEKYSITTEKTVGGHWWIDIRTSRMTTVEWRPKRGFGLSPERNPVYGDGPAEIFATPIRAAARAFQIATGQAGEKGARLSELRKLYHIDQTKLGLKIARGQPAVSRIERGRDSRIETLEAYVRGLGGRIEIKAIFPDSSIPIAVGNESRRHAKNKLGSLAVA